MSQVSLTLNGRIHNVVCDPGQEERLMRLAAYVDQRLQQISKAGAAINESHLMVLTTLVLADEIFDAQERESQALSDAPAAEKTPAEGKDEAKEIARLLETLTKRIETIAAKVQTA